MRIRQVIAHGNRRWVVDFRDGRGKRRHKFFKSPEDARTFAGTVTTGKPSRRRDPLLSLVSLFEGYMVATEARRGVRAQEVTGYRLAHCADALEYLGVIFQDDVDPATWPGLLAHLESKHLAEHTVHGIMAAFKAAMRWGIGQGLLQVRQVGDMQLRAPQKVKERYLSKDEIAELLERLDGHVLRLPVALGIYQGLRRGEIIGLAPGDLDLDKNMLTVGRSKTRDWRVVQLHPALLPYLSGGRGQGPYDVKVPGPLRATVGAERPALCINSRKRAWTGMGIAASLRTVLRAMPPAWHDVSFHVFRHTCASQMALSGKLTLYQIGKFLGHRTVRTTEQYAHLLPGQVKPDW